MTDDTTPAPPDRRTVLRAAAVGGGLVWATPVVQAVASSAHAQSPGTPPPGEIGLSFVILLLERQGTLYRVKFEADGNVVEIGPKIQAPTCGVWPSAPHTNRLATGEDVADVVRARTFAGGGLSVTLQPGVELLDWAVKQGSSCCLKKGEAGYSVSPPASPTSTTYFFPSAKPACAQRKAASAATTRTEATSTPSPELSRTPEPEPEVVAPSPSDSKTVKTKGKG